jgi:hypothetical protein
LVGRLYALLSILVNGSGGRAFGRPWLAGRIGRANFRPMPMRPLMIAAMSLVTFPALAQTTTTVTTAPPEPPQIVQPAVPVVVRDDSTTIETRPSGRSAIQIIAVDSLYGAIGGGAIGGGIALIDQGNHWQRDLMVGAGVGVLVGAGYGVFESATQPPPLRAVADRNAAASDSIGVAPVGYAARF